MMSGSSDGGRHQGGASAVNSVHGPSRGFNKNSNGRTGRIVGCHNNRYCGSDGCVRGNI